MQLSRRSFSALALAAVGLWRNAWAALPSLARAFGGKMLVGAAVRPEWFDGEVGDLVRSQFSVVVAENAMKPEALAPTEYSYAFAAADRLVDAALAAGLKVRGHTLLWHQQMPAWFLLEEGKTVSRDTLIARIEKYIADVVGHFRGRVFAWDVVNEAFALEEKGVASDEAGMRLSPLRSIVGPEFVEIAFRAAEKADPDALLFYNDYETQSPRKLAALSTFLGALKARGVKVDGLGHQCHCSMAHPSAADLERAIDAYARLGLVQHITELDVALNARLQDNKIQQATPALLQAQARRYRELVTLFLRKRAQVSALLFWGIDDAHSWLRDWPVRRFEAPLLFDAQLKPKPAFHAVLAAAREAAVCGGSLDASTNSRTVPC